MLKKIGLALLALVAASLVFVIAGLTWAHIAIRRERAPLPSVQAVLDTATDDTATSDDHPARVSFINTASQAMPRSAVLTASRDPRPDAPYVMSHPSFVLEWADGRMLLIDVGMNREEALAFGRPIEVLGGGSPIQPLTSVAERLGATRQRVRGIMFTHLHTDHTGGIGDLCKGLDHPLPVFMAEAQAERPNFTTRPGLKLIESSGCAHIERLDIAAMARVPGFPGIFVIAAGGHTPGSQIIVAQLKTAQGAHTYVFAGDIANNIDGITHDIPKPLLYRLLIVPEDETRQSELRHFLKALAATPNLTVVVSHDQRALEQSGIPPWSAH